MSDGRKKESGAEYRRRAKEKKEKTDAVVKKIARLDTFFSKTIAPAPLVSVADNPPKPSESAAPAAHKNSDGVQNVNEPSSALTNETNLPVADCNAGSEKDQIPPLHHDPVKWIPDSPTRDYVASNGFLQNMDDDFSKSKRNFGGTVRSLTKAMFTRELLNGEKCARSYLVYSVSKGSVFCGPCRLFGGVSQFAEEGFHDWKNANARISDHENSSEHRSCIMALKQRGNVLGRIDTKLVVQIENEIKYWRDVLKRVVAVVKSLASRGLAFRGQDDKFGSVHNGNFLMGLELIAEFDPFLADHISRYGNKGKGSTSYLSFFTCEQFIQLMAEKVVSHIIKEAKEAKYFSIIVDSTPDVAHIDQLTFIIRYVKNGSPVERFLHFIPNPGHKAESLTEAVLSTLDLYKLDIANCRGQSYDNASNMSEAYTGLQARIKHLNELAVYIPCSAHSLNLVGECAAECCSEASSFFSLLQNLHSYFTASTRRWEILQSQLSFRDDTLSLKKPSATRWLSHGEACHSLSRDWSLVINALKMIEEDGTEKSNARNEARGLLRQLQRLETALMATVWGSLLEKFNKTSVQLQNSSIDVGVAVELYRTLIQAVKDARDRFDSFEKKAMETSCQLKYEMDITRKKKRKLPADESRENEVELTGRESFKVNTFFVILDCLLTELERRGQAYSEFVSRFQSLTHIVTLDTSLLVNKASSLQALYNFDLEDCFPEECLHFRAYLTSNVEGCNSIPVLQMSQILHENDISYVFPNVEIATRIFLCTAVTNCSAERSFSTLKRVKNYLRSRMTEDRLNALSVLSIESELARALDYDDIIDSFATRKVRRKQV
jgi:hypothetical protein